LLLEYDEEGFDATSWPQCADPVPQELSREQAQHALAPRRAEHAIFCFCVGEFDNCYWLMPQAKFVDRIVISSDTKWVARPENNDGDKIERI
jgi:hypothetical protein